MITLWEKLEEGCGTWGIRLSSSQIDQFRLYMDKIKAWNKKINITANDQEEDIIVKHFIDSLAGLRYVEENVQNVMDMGTGAGFPGLPIKIIRPELPMTFVDSSKKKMMVLQDICQTLGIDHYKVMDKNIEIIGREKAFRETYDVVLVRALASLNIILEYGLPILRNKGHMVIYKGPHVEEEVENSQDALTILGGQLKEKDYFYLPLSESQRVILYVEKVGKTPDKYPRSVGIPRKRPIINQNV
jgi:16S rRNA (guanine527-N7)-methyltransferase